MNCVQRELFTHRTAMAPEVDGVKVQACIVIEVCEVCLKEIVHVAVDIQHRPS